MDDRQFDDLSRRIGDSPLSRLPRRGLIAALGGATLASAWRLDDDADAKKKKKNKKCKKEGKGCDKKKCKKQDKKCCCNNLKCQDSVCVGKGGSCPTEVSFNNAWGSSRPVAVEQQSHVAAFPAQRQFLEVHAVGHDRSGWCGCRQQ